MTPSSRWHKWSACVALLLLLVGAAPAPAAETNQVEGAAAEKFLLLTLRYKGGELTLVSSKVVAGALKPQRNSTRPNCFLVQLESDVGGRIWSLTVDDPSVQRYEYEDPDQPGRLRGTEVRTDDVEFLVRVPVDARARQVAIFRPEAAAARGSNALASAASRLLLRHPISTEITR